MNSVHDVCEKFRNAKENARSDGKLTIGGEEIIGSPSLAERQKNLLLFDLITTPLTPAAKEEIQNAELMFAKLYGVGENGDVDAQFRNGLLTLMAKGILFTFARQRGEWIQFFSPDFSYRLEFPLEKRSKTLTLVIETAPTDASQLIDCDFLSSLKWLMCWPVHVTQRENS